MPSSRKTWNTSITRFKQCSDTWSGLTSKEKGLKYPTTARRMLPLASSAFSPTKTTIPTSKRARILKICTSALSSTFEKSAHRESSAFLRRLFARRWVFSEGSFSKIAHSNSTQWTCASCAFLWPQKSRTCICIWSRSCSKTSKRKWRTPRRFLTWAFN